MSASPRSPPSVSPSGDAKAPLLPDHVGNIATGAESRSTMAKFKMMAWFVLPLAAAALLFSGVYVPSNSHTPAVPGAVTRPIAQVPVSPINAAASSKAAASAADLAAIAHSFDRIARECSGHGFKINGDMCACDYGFDGAMCATASNVDAIQADRKTKTTKSMAMFIDALKTDGSYDSAMGLNLVRGVIGAHGSLISHFTVYTRHVELTKRALAEHLDLVKVKAVPGLPDLSESNAPAYLSKADIDAANVATAAEVAAEAYDLLYIDANAVIGGNLAASRALGAACNSARILVGVTQPSPLDVNVDELPTDIKLRKAIDEQALMVEMQRRTLIETADHVLYLDLSLRAKAAGLKRIPNHAAAINAADNGVYKLIGDSDMPFIMSNLHTKFRHEFAKDEGRQFAPRELVFFSTWSNEAGIKNFIDALDDLHTVVADSGRPLGITFLGIDKSAQKMEDVVIDGTPVREYLLNKANNWPRFAIAINARPITARSVVSYMTEKTTGRFAVLPEMEESTMLAPETQKLIHELVLSHVPMMAPAALKFEHALSRKDDGASDAENIDISRYHTKDDPLEFSMALITSLQAGVSAPHKAARRIAKRNADSFALFAEMLRAESPCSLTSTLPLHKISVIVVHDAATMSVAALERSIDALEKEQLEYRQLEVILVSNGARADSPLGTLVQSIDDRWAAREWIATGINTGRTTEQRLAEAIKIGSELATGAIIVAIPSSVIPKPHMINVLARAAFTSGEAADVFVAGLDVVGVISGRKASPASDSIALPMLGANGIDEAQSLIAVRRDAATRVPQVLTALAKGNAYMQLVAAKLNGLNTRAIPSIVAWSLNKQRFSPLERRRSEMGALGEISSKSFTVVSCSMTLKSRP
ncbi:hypothetical protein BC828DRAFT_418593 [Blastocladiella britannica]|nr:hypothetical protein BC828DRAFT_418593 [Blastocladiella britannica]